MKELRIPLFFLTLPCADLRWEEVIYITNKLNKIEYNGNSEEVFKN